MMGHKVLLVRLKLLLKLNLVLLLLWWLQLLQCIAPWMSRSRRVS